MLLTPWLHSLLGVGVGQPTVLVDVSASERQCSSRPAGVAVAGLGCLWLCLYTHEQNSLEEKRKKVAPRVVVFWNKCFFPGSWAWVRYRVLPH